MRASPLPNHPALAGGEARQAGGDGDRERHDVRTHGRIQEENGMVNSTGVACMSRVLLEKTVARVRGHGPGGFGRVCLFKVGVRGYGPGGHRGVPF